MSSHDAPAGKPRRRRHVRFSAKLAREICRRISAGETLASICDDPRMPCRQTVNQWARDLPGFARIYSRARAMAGPIIGNQPPQFCPATAQQIAARVSEGETMTSILSDPMMPSGSTVWMWRQRFPEFEEALQLARSVMAERFSDLGWEMAMAATPETAFLTKVRLSQLRWMTTIMAPHTHGRMKAVDPPAAPDVLNVTVRNFQTEVNPETGQVRSIAYHHDPETGGLVRDLVGEWRDPPFPLVRQVDYVTAKTRRMELGMNTDNPALWDTRVSAKDAPEA
jgi:hypothetical protein